MQHAERCWAGGNGGAAARAGADHVEEESGQRPRAVDRSRPLLLDGMLLLLLQGRKQGGLQGGKKSARASCCP